MRSSSKGGSCDGIRYDSHGQESQRRAGVQGGLGGGIVFRDRNFQAVGAAVGEGESPAPQGRGDESPRSPSSEASGGLMGSAMEKTLVGRRRDFLASREKACSRKAKGQYPAPIEAIDVIQETGARYGSRFAAKSREHAMAREAKGFGKLAVTRCFAQSGSNFLHDRSGEKVERPSGRTSGRRLTRVHHAAVLGRGRHGRRDRAALRGKNIPTRG